MFSHNAFYMCKKTCHLCFHPDHTQTDLTNNTDELVIRVWSSKLEIFRLHTKKRATRQSGCGVSPDAAQRILIEKQEQAQ